MRSLSFDHFSLHQVSAYSQLRLNGRHLSNRSIRFELDDEALNNVGAVESL